MMNVLWLLSVIPTNKYMQHPTFDQAAFILYRRDYQDTSLILDLFTEDFGKLSVLAKGARKRRDAMSFQLCNRLSVGWTGNSDLKLLTRIESHVLKVTPKNIPAVFYINELLLYLLPKQQEQHKLFHLYQALLVQLSLNDTVLEVELRNFEIELLTELGVMPDLLVDADQGGTVDVSRTYVLKDLCGPVLTDATDENSLTGAQLQAIHQRQFSSPNTLRVAKKLMRQIIDFNLQGRTLQSRKFYQQMHSR